MSIYFFKNNVSGDFIAAETDVLGFFPTTIYTQEHADTLNKRLGHTPAEVKAAEACSMFDRWDDFNSMVEMFS